MMKFLKATVLCIGLMFVAGNGVAASDIQTRIVGGTEVPNDTKYPWAVLLSNSTSTNDFFCGGSLIAEKWVLTAAHCMVDAIDGSVYAFVGEHDKTDGDVVANPIDKIIIHPDYDSVTSDNDIALLRLTTAETTITPLNIITTSVALTLEGLKFDEDVDVTVIGWGDTQNPLEGGATPTVLREVGLPYIDTAVCNAPAALNDQVSANMMCAGVAAGGIDSCQGDSGGPMVFFDGGNWYQAGIVSWGYGCAEPNKYGVYTRVENYIDWIEKTKTFTPFLDFTTWVSGKTVSAVIEVDNSTAGSFSISGITSTNDLIFQEVANNCPNPINVGDSCNIEIQFLASTVGNYAETISIETSSSDLGTVDIPVTGRIANTFNYVAVELDSSMNWALGGDSNWYERYITTTGYALQSGNIADNQFSSVFAYLNVTGGAMRTVTFDWKVCSEPNYDYLQLWVDYKKVDALSGNADWSRKSFDVTGDGDHIIEWRFNKDYTVSRGDDAGWIDNVSVDSAPANGIPVHKTACDVSPPPPPSSGGGSLSGWFYLGLGIPLLLGRRRQYGFFR